VRDLALGIVLLRRAHLRQCFRQPAAGTPQNGGGHFQIALERGRLGCFRRRRSPLRFEKQLRRSEQALAHRPRTVPPGGIELPGFPRLAVMLREGRGHPFAVIQTDAGHRHQILHRNLCRHFALAHELLNRLRQQFHQRQAPRHPAHAAIETLRQLFEPIAETLFHLGQQPTLLQRALVFRPAQRTVQQESFGFAHRPQQRFHRVPTQLLEGGDALVTVDDQVALRSAFHRHHHDRRLLARCGQRRQKPALPRRMAHPEMFTAPVELVKFQSLAPR